MIHVRRALLSVSRKDGLVELARGLADLGVELVSTGGTAAALAAAGLPVRLVSEITGFPEILDGRVKSLHPRIHAGILAVRDNEAHRRQLAAHGIDPIDLVVVNLYPFEEAAAHPDLSPGQVIEEIDIGGPALVRAAAKNHHDVAVVVDPARYPEVLAALRAGGGRLPRELARRLAAEAFAHTAAYDAAIARWLAGLAGPSPEDGSPFPPRLELGGYQRLQVLRYGENPHQRAAIYRDPGWQGPSVVAARQLHGKELSFNNLADAAAALELLREFDTPAAVVVKHANPCGVAVADTLATAFRKAHAADPVSIFGGIVALNRPVDPETAQLMAEIFLEVILAPAFEPAALAILTRKKNVRLLAVPGLKGEPAGPGQGAGPEAGGPHRFPLELRSVPGGLLVQEPDRLDLDPGALRVVTRAAPAGDQWADLRFAWRVVKHVKSNAIVVAGGGQTLGIGAGQTNRIDAARLALAGAGEKARGAVLASDAFFPFPDVVEAAARAGIRAIIQPGGSVRDPESIAAADQAGIAMVFTGIRHFRH